MRTVKELSSTNLNRSIIVHLAVADSSKGGKEVTGNYVLTVADCRRMLELEFPLTSRRLRKQSLAKIDLLAQIINQFKDAIHAEAELIDQQAEK